MHVETKSSPITRAQFVAAIEAGIEAAADVLTDDERAELRDFAHTAPVAAVGAGITNSGGVFCYCPAEAVGLKRENKAEAHSPWSRFAFAYDDYITDEVKIPRSISVLVVND